MRSSSSNTSFASSSLTLLWLDTADLSDHGPAIVLQVLKIHLGQWPSFNGIEHGAGHARATGLVREVASCENW